MSLVLEDGGTSRNQKKLARCLLAEDVSRYFKMFQGLF
jgi:hypothetical protein